jgi:hypothetical protein
MIAHPCLTLFRGFRCPATATGRAIFSRVQAQLISAAELIKGRCCCNG